MKHSIYIVLAFMLIIFLGSCKKEFLDVEDKSGILRQQYVKDLKTLGEFLNGTYILLTQFYYAGPNQAYPDLIADNIKAKSGGNQLIAAYKWAQLAAGSTITVYAYNYKIVKACNFIIEKSEEFRNENPVLADNLKAQALTLRALIHFTTVNAYAQSYNFTVDASHPGIALSQTSDPFEPLTRRNTVAEVYTSIIEDLNTSFPLFSSDNISSTLLINKVAAKALLSRVFLFKQDYTSAKNLAREVIAKVPVMSSNYPANLFTLNETEALFQLAPSSSAVQSGAFSTNFLGRYFVGTTSNVQFLATSDIAGLLTADPNDSRKVWIKSSGVGKDTIKKYPVNVKPGFNPTTQSYYPTIIRSSEMCLTAAEAYANINMEDSARYFLDVIRKRANPLALSTSAAGAALLDIIYTERRKELAFEGLRMYDLLRWKKGVTRGADVTNGAPMSLPYGSNMAVAPIPLSDIQITGLQQNPGY